jgi:cytochrome b
MKVLVWDWPTRLFHWLLLACVIGSIVSVKIGGNAMNWHFRFGYCALGLITFRILWGFIGSRYARFSSFPPSPARTIAYLKGRAAQTLGHNPLGAWSVYALLAAFGFQAVSGLFSNDDIAFEGPLSKHISSAWVSRISALHQFNEWVIYTLIALHIGAILYYRYRKKQDLLTPMITGEKPGAIEAAAQWNTGKTMAAIVLAVLCAAAVTLIVNL